MPTITTPTDPRLALFTAMRDRDIRRETGLCLAEGEHLVRRAFEAGLAVRSVLVVEQKRDRVEAMLADRRPGLGPAGQVETIRSGPRPGLRPEVFSCNKQLLEQVVGFELHQGIVAAVEPPAAWDGLDGLGRAIQRGEEHKQTTLLVCPEITNAENLGLLARVAAGLGVSAMVLGPRCADPWYRRAVRVSMGAVFKLPMVRLDDLDRGLAALREEHGYSLVATVTDADATPLKQTSPARNTKHAILLGSEGYGLSSEVVAQCDERVCIPMHAGVDSLNVAVAAGIVLHHYSPQT